MSMNVIFVSCYFIIFGKFPERQRMLKKIEIYTNFSSKSGLVVRL